MNDTRWSQEEDVPARLRIIKEGFSTALFGFWLNDSAFRPFLSANVRSVSNHNNPPHFAVWMREHYRLVLSQCRRMLGVTEDAEDVTQVVFVKAWRKWDEFEGDDAQRRAWLLRIARNATLDAVRKRDLRRMAPLDVVLEKRTAEILNSPDFEGEVILARLHAAISTLPPKQRWVFQARYFDDRPYLDLVAETGTTAGALKASYHHAKKKIEAILQKEAESLFH